MTLGTTLDGSATRTAQQAVGCGTWEGRHGEPSAAAVTVAVKAAIGGPDPTDKSPVLCLQSFRRSPLRVQCLSTFLDWCVTLRRLLRGLLVLSYHPLSMASTRCQPVTLSYPHGPISRLDYQTSKPAAPSDAMALGSTARFNPSAVGEPMPMNNRQVPAQGAGDQFLSTGCMTDPSEEADHGLPLRSEIPAPSRQVIDLTIDDDDDDLPLRSEIPTPSRQVIDLTIDDNDNNNNNNGDGDGDEVTEVRRFRNG